MEFNPVQTTPYGVGYKIKSRLWGIINSTIFRWTPFFMRKTRVALLRLFGANVDWSCSVSGGAEIVDPWNLSMGALSSIDKECCIRCRGKVTIGAKCCISRGVDILTGSHNIFSSNFEMVTAPVTIEDNVWVATKVTVGMGVTIGKASVLATRAVVVKNVPMYAIVEGNPARVTSFRCKLDEIIENEPWLKTKETDKFEEIQKIYNQLYGHNGERNGSLQLSNGMYPQEQYDNVFCSVFGVERTAVRNMIYKNSPEWDSVGHMNLVVEIEHTFGVRLRTEDFLSFNSYTSGIDILNKYGVVLAGGVCRSFSNEFFDFSAYADKIAIQTEKHKFTYRDLDKKSLELKDIVKNRRLAFILAQNTIGSVACYVGCIKNKIPVAILDANKDVDFIMNLINQYHPDYIILPTDKKIEYEGTEIGTIYDYSILHIGSSNYPISEDLTLLLTTSGSTGSPKFVRLTTANIQSNAQSIAEYLELNENERPIMSLPMYYSYGLSVINSHFIVGATIILTPESVVTPHFWNIAAKFMATSISGVPYTYDLFKKIRVMDMDLPSLKTFTQAGGKMNKDDVYFFASKCKERGRKLVVMYGQTEASPRISYLPFERAMDKSDSIGIPIPGVDLSISDESELVCKGGNVFQGYAESCDDLCKGDEYNGVLHTGDLAKKDSDGYFYIIGRKKRFVKVYGNRIGLDELEQLLAPIYGRIVCVGRDDSITIYTENKETDLESVAKFVSEKTKISHTAFHVRYIEQIPCNDSGKPQYTSLEIL